MTFKCNIKFECHFCRSLLRWVKLRFLAVFHRDMCRMVMSIRATEKTESGRKRTARDYAFSCDDDHCYTNETVDLGQRWGPPTLPVSRGCKPQLSFLRFQRRLSWKVRYYATQDGKGDPIWPTEETAKKKQRKTVRCTVVHPQNLTSSQRDGRVNVQFLRIRNYWLSNR